MKNFARQCIGAMAGVTKARGREERKYGHAGNSLNLRHSANAATLAASINRPFRQNEIFMNKLVLLSIAFCINLISCAGKIDYKNGEEYITESEKQWAESVASGDTNVIKRILADDFIGVDPQGNHYDKKTMVKETASAPQYFLSNHLNDVKIRFYDNFAIAQGNETWIKRADSSTARFVWTDTWIYRDNRWEILAAEDLIAPVK